MNKFSFDFISKVLKKYPEVRESMEESTKKELIEQVPRIVERQAELPSYITNEAGFYLNLLREARQCYEYALFHSAIAMISITAERFAIELFNRMEISINGYSLDENDLYGKNKLGQYRRLRILKKSKAITGKTFGKLDEK